MKKSKYEITWGFAIFEGRKKVGEKNFDNEKDWVYALYKEGFYDQPR